jgi:response regulator RpfG family c-di-GMP phosphodiesterase
VKDRGTHFDPDVVDAFLRCEAKFHEVRARFTEPLSLAA